MRMYYPNSRFAWCNGDYEIVYADGRIEGFEKPSFVRAKQRLGELHGLAIMRRRPTSADALPTHGLSPEMAEYNRFYIIGAGMSQDVPECPNEKERQKDV